MGTPDFAVGVLAHLVENKKNIVAVITAPDRPAGRGRKLKPSAVKEYAIAHEIPVLQPTNLKDVNFITTLKSFQADLQIVVAFRMLPKVVWQLPEFGTFNLHASLLPEYRGAAPINWAIINQEKTTGVTTFFIDEKIDTGEIILQQEVDIASQETVGSLHDTLQKVGSELVLKTVAQIENGSIATQPQPLHSIYKEAPKLTHENTKIDWNKSILEIDALVRGLSPYPVAWCYLENDDEKLKIKVYRTGVENTSVTEAVGTVITDKKTIKVAASDGYVLLEALQLPGKRKMDAGSLLNGFSFSEDAKLS